SLEFWQQALRIDWEQSTARVKYFPGAPFVYAITLVREDLVAALLTEGLRCPPVRTESAETKHGPQVARVLRWLKAKFLPDGRTDLPVETLRGQCATDLETDSRAKGLADPSWDSVQRALALVKLDK